MTVQFPLGLAIGPNFCNRVDERALLKAHIDKTIHTWLTAPRRFGKTSLIAQTLRDLSKQKKPLIHQNIDILTVSDVDDLQVVLLHAIGKVVSQIVPPTQKALQNSLNYFKQLRPELVLRTDGPSLKFTPTSPPQKSITEVLTGLDSLIEQHNRKVVIVFDEFQRLAEIDPSSSLEAAIRHVVERAQHTTYLFSGSHRSLLEQMFENKKRPLYHLCTRLGIDRISEQDYRDFLNKRATLTWNKSLNDKSFNAIVQRTQRHPYYMNKLCGLVWRHKTSPSPKQVQQSWRQVLDEERSLIAAQLGQLSRNQQRVFMALAQIPTQHPSGTEFASKLNLASSSIRQCIKVLLDDDYIYQDHHQVYRVLNPAAQSILAHQANT